MGAKSLKSEFVNASASDGNFSGVSDKYYRKFFKRMTAMFTKPGLISLDEEAKRKKIPYSFNMVLGPAALAAYELESRKAFYPRIIVDDAFLQYCTEKQITLEDYYFIQDVEGDYYYLDYWNYMFKGKPGQADFLIGCVEYIKKELKYAKVKGNDKLEGQINWYIRFLESHLLD